MSKERLKTDMGDLREWNDPHFQEQGHLASLFFELRSARKRGFLTQKELVEIAKTKSPRRYALAKENTPEEVKAVTSLAYDVTKIKSERVRAGLLCSLRGVSVPTASCLLSWVYPDEWPVIDQRAWRTLATYSLVNGNVARRLSCTDYENYVALCREIASDKSVSPQLVDRWLYARNKMEGMA
jgi:thermostable 8-oxoguanine DNA glycosylase